MVHVARFRWLAPFRSAFGTLKHYIRHLSNSCYQFIEENHIMMIIVIIIVLSPSPSHNTVHHTLLHMGPIRVPVHHQNHLKWVHWTLEQWKKVAWSEESGFLLNHVDSYVRVCHLPLHDDALWDNDKLLEGVWCWVQPFKWTLIWHMLPNYLNLTS